jgi:hypothetical protein
MSTLGAHSVWPEAVCRLPGSHAHLCLSITQQASQLTIIHDGL